MTNGQPKFKNGVWSLTQAKYRALRAVADASTPVYQTFDMNGNTFKGPKGISSKSFRFLSESGFIDDQPMPMHQRPGGWVQQYRQQLTTRGWDLLRKIEADPTLIRG